MGTALRPNYVISAFFATTIDADGDSSSYAAEGVLRSRATRSRT